MGKVVELKGHTEAEVAEPAPETPPASVATVGERAAILPFTAPQPDSPDWLSEWNGTLNALQVATDDIVESAVGLAMTSVRSRLKEWNDRQPVGAVWIPSSGNGVIEELAECGDPRIARLSVILNALLDGLDDLRPTQAPPPGTSI
jgi:hypothetical protein